VIIGGGISRGNLLTHRDFRQLKIIYYRDGYPVYVEHLPVEEMQMRIEPTRLLIIAMGSHCPAPVTIMSGMAASAAARMSTR
jgi:hypothetical protein